MDAAPADFPRLSARFSFNDFPDFLVMDCRGDLSDITGPSYGGLIGSRFGRLYPTAELVRDDSAARLAGAMAAAMAWPVVAGAYMRLAREILAQRGARVWNRHIRP